MSEAIRLRTYAFLDNMQPQYAAMTGTVVKGDPCLAGMAQLYIELEPGSGIYNLLDVAVKVSNAKPGFLIVERNHALTRLREAAVVAPGLDDDLRIF